MSDKCKICGKQVQYLPAHLKRHNTTIVKYGQRCPEWICFRNALIDSRMTPTNFGKQYN
ncbi:MAG: hypothetical protein ACUVXA_16570 [Candidatus Jordarchaeum sp.]|uniref:hypothetical protein n=1 Tax=Candidatus Jordarchaeum sp. TaxID=2823881 RepID=UPI00404A1147